MSVTVLDADRHPLVFRRDGWAVLNLQRDQHLQGLHRSPAQPRHHRSGGGSQARRPIPQSVHRALQAVAVHHRRLPVHRAGRLIGAIGVGGGAPEQDHAFATTVLTTLA
ncbi:heme-binding protein [Streptomyces sp. NBC_00846]|uniref:heme-binding protein n=1 Tax=Streptomyces sp. NBC_00846 TaxID=2975849 RepID=UPI00386D8CCA